MLQYVLFIVWVLALASTPSLDALVPARLRRLLWVLCVSSGLLALEGIVQRTFDTGKLLFLVQARVNPARLAV